MHLMCENDEQLRNASGKCDMKVEVKFATGVVDFGGVK